MEGVRKIKKYANRKMYDTQEKDYITLEKLAALIKEGEEVLIEDNETGEDITASTVSQILAKEKNGEHAGILIRLLRKSSGSIIGYAKKTAESLQNVFTTAEDEMDKLVNRLVKDREISESEGSSLKTELMGYVEQFKRWIGDRIDKRISEVLSMMNLASKEQVNQLTAKIEELTKTVERLEKLPSEGTLTSSKEL